MLAGYSPPPREPKATNPTPATTQSTTSTSPPTGTTRRFMIMFSSRLALQRISLVALLRLLVLILPYLVLLALSLGNIPMPALRPPELALVLPESALLVLPLYCFAQW